MLVVVVIVIVTTTTKTTVIMKVVNAETVFVIFIFVSILNFSLHLNVLVSVVTVCLQPY